MLQVTIREHVVYDGRRKENVKFDQYQILLGQRLVGYLGKDPKCRPVLVIKGLPEDAIAAINQAAVEKLGPEAGPAVESQLEKADE